MTTQETTVVNRLRLAGSPRDFNNWREQEGHYVATCRVSADDVPQLIDLVRKWTDPEWPTLEDEPDSEQHAELELLPVTAWRTLADLKSSEAVEPLIEMLCDLEDEFDEWMSEELPYVFGKIGEPAIEPLVQLAKDTNKPDLARSIAVRGLKKVADGCEAARNSIVEHLTQMMADVSNDPIRFNSTVLVELVDLQAIEAAEAIERAFAADFIDLGMMGDWEAVRKKLGVKSLGLEMPANPHNSMDGFRRAMGIGIFSDKIIYSFGELDEEAAGAYYKRADAVFSRSDEAQRVIDRDGELGWFQSLLEFGLNYLGETVDQMTVESLDEFLFEYVPKKVSTEPESADAIVYELTMFWMYLDSVFELPEAKPIVDWLQADGLAGKLESELADPANYGMAKSFFMAGSEAGYDMTSEAGLAEFMAVYNQSLNQSGPSSAPTIAPMTTPVTTLNQEPRVGRNDPCPCGSGKKYKKCCRK